jgi:hypothetical protein
MFLALMLGLAAQAVNPCALLTTADIQHALAAPAAIKQNTNSTPAVGSTACTYEWGSGGNVQSGKSSLIVIVSDAKKMFPGMSAALITKGLSGEKDSTPIPGVGDAAVFKSASPISANASAYVKGRILEIAYESKDGRAKKDAIIALLTSAAERLD